MFTGLVETVGTIEKIRRKDNYYIFDIKSTIVNNNLQIGESVSCDGACLTVVSFDNKSFVVEASQETKDLTLIDKYKVGSEINLERAMKMGDRLGGHLVSGHIDCRGKIEYIKPIGKSLEIAVSFNSDFNELVITKGSIAINGISLTINKVNSGHLTVNIIPHTTVETTVKNWKQADSVNLEFDMIGKYVLNRNKNDNNNSLTIDKLLKSGW